MPPLLLGISLGANVTLLACLLSVLLFARAGDFSPLRSAAPSAPSAATPSPTPPALGNLTVSPATVYPCVGGPDATFTVTYAGTGSAATLTVTAPSSHEFRVSVNGGSFGYTVTASTSAGNPATVTVHARFGGSDTIRLSVNVSGVPQQSVTANTSGGTCGGG